jgi:transcriptional regulator with XRE-family HTH domain
MGKAGGALKQTLEQHGISQNQLAVTLGVERPIVFRWYHGQVDPTAETVAEIVEALQSIRPKAAESFVRLYLGVSTQTEQVSLTLTSPSELPVSNDVNVAALSRLFAETTNSYKYLFFISLLDILRRRQFDVLSPISFYEIIVEMLANAWYPHTYFKLSFGTQDKLTQKLDSLDLEIGEPILKFTDTDKRLLRKTIASQNLKDVVSELRRYVPFRLIIPFIEAELENFKKGIRGKSNEADIAVPRIVDQYFDVCKPLYRFNSAEYKQCDSLNVHPEWADYIEKNYKIIRSWASWEWLEYMQKRNPSTPAIINKLFAPSKRDSLSKQTQYWKIVLQRESLRCIYTDEILNISRFSLDHYLPWSFVAHDQLWNLIPTFPETNSSKSNDLAPDSLFEKFVDFQYAGLQLSRQYMSEDIWEKRIEPFKIDLGIGNTQDLLDLDKLRSAYGRVVPPLISLASSQGFKVWRR